MPGFGQNPGSRYGVQPLLRTIPLREIEPAPAWNGAPASGFVTLPVDPVRTTAKPAVRLLVPPRQRFTNTLVVGVGAFANNGGTLIGGIDRVRFHFEGRVVDVMSPVTRRFKDANGNTVGYFGYWVQLRRPVGKTGEARLYVEAIPADATMQRRVLGPFSFYPATTLHDREFTVNPDLPTTATNFPTFDAALSALKLVTPPPANPRITFKKAMSNVPMTALGTLYTPSSYITVEADFPVSFGYATMNTTASVDSVNILRPRAGPMWLKGTNITIDYARADTVFAETGHSWVLDGIRMTNTLGPGALWRGGTNSNLVRVIGNPYFLECTISNIRGPCIGASLARGGVLSNVSSDIFTDARCIVGTRVQRQNDNSLNNDEVVVSVVYNGPAATATVAKSGGVDPNTAIYTFKWGANSATFETGKLTSYYAGTAGQGYTFAHLANWINTTLAALGPGWSATLSDTQGRRAGAGSLAGLKGQPFGDSNCKTTPRQIVANFDMHGDWYQQLFGGLDENVLGYNNIGYDMQVQNIFLSSTTSSRDMVFVNNAFGNDRVGSDYFNEATVFSQMARPGVANQMSHLVIVHCSMPNQGLVFRNDGATLYSTFDSLCLVANNVFRSLGESTTVAGRGPGATIRNNHIHAGQTPLAEAVGTTIGGNRDTLFVDFNTGNFTPAGVLLTTLKAPVADLGNLHSSGAPLALGASL
jgi:hypothetical protein